MVYFLDTTVFLTYAHSFDKDCLKAQQIVNGSPWVTPPEVAGELGGDEGELTHIFRRRQKIYLNVLHGLKCTEGNIPIKFQGKRFSDVFSSCFKSAIDEKNRNDRRHIKLLFETCLSDIGIRETQEINVDRLESFRKVFIGHSKHLNILIGKFNSDFKQLQYRKEHVIDTKSPQHKKFTRALFREGEIRDRSKHKLDIDILASAFDYAYSNNVQVEVISSDSFFESAQSAVLSVAKKIYLVHTIQPTIVIQNLQDL